MRQLDLLSDLSDTNQMFSDVYIHKGMYKRRHNYTCSGLHTQTHTYTKACMQTHPHTQKHVPTDIYTHTVLLISRKTYRCRDLYS